jgi:uncharacterized membrane protein YdbT with pleckstrin-like domain
MFQRPSAGIADVSEDEITLYESHPKMWRDNVFGFVICIILVPVVLGIVSLAIWYLQVICTTLTVTNKRTILRKGVLSKSVSEVWNRDIRNIQIYQSLMQRLFGVGNIGISSSGQGDIEIAVSGLPDPEGIRTLIDQYR